MCKCMRRGQEVFRSITRCYLCCTHSDPNNTQGLATGQQNLLAPLEEPVAKSTTMAQSSARCQGQTGASAPCSSMKAMFSQHQLPEGVFQQDEALLTSHHQLSKEQTRKAGQKIP